MRPAARPAALALAGALLLGPAAASAASAVPVTTAPVAVVAATPSAPATTPGGAATPAPAPVARDDTGTGLVLPIIVTTVVVLVAGGLAFAAGVQRRARDERRL